MTKNEIIENLGFFAEIVNGRPCCFAETFDGMALVVSGEDGFYPMPLEYWAPVTGKRKARSIAAALNRSLGLTTREACLMAAASMRKQSVLRPESFES